MPSVPSIGDLTPFVAYFCNTSPSPNLLQTDSDAGPDDHLSIPSIPAVARSGSASPRTVAASDVLPPAGASNNVRTGLSEVSPKVSSGSRLASHVISLAAKQAA